jgi:hypothetical protein
MAEYGNGKGSANENGKSKSKGTMNVVVAGKAVNGALLNAALPSNVMSSHTMKALGLKPTSPSSQVGFATFLLLLARFECYPHFESGACKKTTTLCY